ncbi:MAG: 5-formyltetrahydrofolate cyclo-ligase [bacterium]
MKSPFWKIDWTAFFSLDNKEVFRAQAKARRKELSAQRKDASLHAAAVFMRHIAPEPDKIVALYYTTGTELDTWPLAEALLANGNQICLPVVKHKDHPLAFRHYQQGTELVKGQFNIPTPPPGATECLPDIVVTPLLAFTSTGARLGYGGGYYDRTLNDLRNQKHILAVGYAYGGQEMSNLPTTPHDEVLDWIITERQALAF